MLTVELAARAERVVAVEIDEKLRPVLEETLDGFSNVRVIFSDVLKLDLQKLIREEFAGLDVVVCANLPYYVTSPILMSLLEQRLPIRSITVMVQKEAAARLCAQMGTRECGAVTAAVRWYSEPEVLFSVSRGSFMPPPNVDSAVIRLTVREESPGGLSSEDEALLFRMIRLAFSQRRKTMANPLSVGLQRSKAEIAAALEQAGAKTSARPEELTMEQWVALTKALA